MNPGEQVRYAYDPTLTGKVVAVEPDGVRVAWNWEGRAVTGLHHTTMIDPVMHRQVRVDPSQAQSFEN